jgi:SAM-dependent methyltransferase
MKCRHCCQELEHTFIDLGFSPPSNAYLKMQDLKRPEKHYPLQVMVCNECWLVQTLDYADADELFTADYAYFSSTSNSWLAHAKKYCEDITTQLKLDKDSLVIEVASNDGYLLKNFVQRNIPCLGIEPTHSTATAALELGVPVLEEFFGQQLAQKLADQGKKADLILGNNVYAHVPDINDFTRAIKTLLKVGGTVTLEFPHLLNLIRYNQFDTIYHEHFSYLSLQIVSRIFRYCGLRLWHVEELITHGGSLRVYGCHEDDPRHATKEYNELLEQENFAGLQQLSTYQNLQFKANVIKEDFLEFMLIQRKARKKVAAYGAAAKGNTLLNFSGVKSDWLDYVCDAAVAKQGKFLPGSHIPVLKPAEIALQRPDFILILPWNLRDEITKLLNPINTWGAKYVTAIPALEIW